MAQGIKKHYRFSNSNISANRTRMATQVYFDGIIADEDLAKETQKLRQLFVQYAALKESKFISGHVFYHDSFKELQSRGYLLISLLRTPVDRWFSEYFYNRYKSSDHNETTLDIEEYMASPVGQLSGQTYVQYFSGSSPNDNKADKVEKAKTNLKNFDCLGTLEQKTKYLMSLKQKLGFSINLSHKRRNPAYANEETAQLMKKYKESEELRTSVKALCQDDQHIYQFVCEND